MLVYYYENGKCVESDFLLDETEAYDWFVESYNIHTGRNPTAKKVRLFMDRYPTMILRNQGTVTMEWVLC